jgi:hypothetical protein
MPVNACRTGLTVQSSVQTTLSESQNAMSKAEAAQLAQAARLRGQFTKCLESLHAARSRDAERAAILALKNFLAPEPPKVFSHVAIAS